MALTNSEKQQAFRERQQARRERIHDFAEMMEFALDSVIAEDDEPAPDGTPLVRIVSHWHTDHLEAARAMGRDLGLSTTDMHEGFLQHAAQVAAEMGGELRGRKEMAAMATIEIKRLKAELAEMERLKAEYRETK